MIFIEVMTIQSTICDKLVNNITREEIYFSVTVGALCPTNLTLTEIIDKLKDFIELSDIYLHRARIPSFFLHIYFSVFREKKEKQKTNKNNKK